MTDDDLARLAGDDYLAYVEAYADARGVEVLDLDGVRVRRSDARDAYLSSVFGARLGPLASSALQHRIDAVVDVLGRDGRSFYWSIWPGDTPVELAEALLEAGFEDDGSQPLMTLDLAEWTVGPQPRPDGLVVREVTDPTEMHELAAFAVQSVGWEDDDVSPYEATFLRLAMERPPRLRMFGGWLDGRLVASSALYTGTGVAGIYAVATLEDVRGRGIGRAVTAAAVDAGRAAGLTTAVLLSSDLGQPVYRRLGFREVGTVRFLRWPGATATD